MLPISVCIIAKNEEKNIKSCLEALKPYHFEIIIVDTGSTDRTKSIARRYTRHIYDYEWCNDFSAARNFSIEKASNDWILVVDCDEILQRFNQENVAAYMEEYPTRIGMITRMDEIPDPTGKITYENSMIERLFHRDYYHYESIIHEQVMPLTNKPYESGIPIHVIFVHTGYNIPKEQLNEKNRRNIQLLEEAVLSEPDNAYYYFQLGRSYYTLENYKESRKALDHALTLDLSPSALYTKMLYATYGNLNLAEGRTQDNITLLESAQPIIGDYSDAVYMLATSYFHEKNYTSAILNYIKAINSPLYTNYATKTYLSQYMLGVLYEGMGNKELALSFFRNCPNHLDAAERIQRLSHS